MSATLHATGSAAGHGDRMLFSGLDLVVAAGDVVGLVGANGAGKSMLLRVLAGQAIPQDSAVVRSPPDATVGHLPQEPDRRPGETMWSFLARRTGVAQAQATMDTAAQALAGDGPDYYSAALDRWLVLGGADLNERAAEVAAELGLGVDLDDRSVRRQGRPGRAGGAATDPVQAFRDPSATQPQRTIPSPARCNLLILRSIKEPIPRLWSPERDKISPAVRPPQCLTHPP